jgi:mRNA interferase HigB
MRVFARKALREFWEKHPDSEVQLATWYREATKANWKSPAENRNTPKQVFSRTRK